MRNTQVYVSVPPNEANAKALRSRRKKAEALGTCSNDPMDGLLPVRLDVGRGRTLTACLYNGDEEVAVYREDFGTTCRSSLYRTTVCMDGHILARIETQAMSEAERRKHELYASSHDAPFAVRSNNSPQRCAINSNEGVKLSRQPSTQSSAFSQEREFCRVASERPFRGKSSHVKIAAVPPFTPVRPASEHVSPSRRSCNTARSHH
ncbi:hypothetical protein DQ04_00691080 [Trypanosoma grayi]|uniref:hypothetical protein n=1 Tax=Trypanosoma grayi TaxID=71804 RepID=UPI0004F42E86|nr:hypothetical protein DQ04_00691080 [Trypanosoma grayi]KEG13962.1 hypothetical protein DQ04_00691080 [Trypanosoma grayi]